mgnify:CR=1 FL=1
MTRIGELFPRYLGSVRSDYTTEATRLFLLGAIETIDIDEVIVSVGVSPNPLVPNSIEGLEVTPKGTIVVNADTLQSSIPDIYAGGDIVRGGATVILAMGDGRRAAAAMHKALQEK